MNFAENIDRIRKYFNCKNAGLEKILGLSNGYLSGLEKNLTDNPGKLLLALNTKGISADWFLSGEGEMFLSKTSREIANTLGSFKIPLIRQKVSCGPGQNWEEEQNIQDYISILTMLPRITSGRLYALNVHGSSMLGAGIKDGDYVVFDSHPDQPLRDGNYVFSLDGDVFCKRLEHDQFAKKIKIYSVRVADLDKAELQNTLNDDDERLRIFGRVISCIRSM